MITDSNVSEGIRLGKLAARLRRQGAAFARLARAAPSPEMVHRLRVLTRRMRAACAAGRRMADDEAFRAFAKRLRKIGRALGERRALDVAAADYAALSGGRTHPAIEKARAETQGAVFKRLKPRKRAAVAEALERAVRVFESSEADPEAAERHLRDRMAQLRAHASAKSKEELHALRVEAKKTRYALELFRAMGRGAAPEAERALKRLQRTLGRVHDFEVLQSFLQDGDSASPRAAAREEALRAEAIRLAPAALRTAAAAVARIF
jgi:CHAD domain-containing protein